MNRKMMAPLLVIAMLVSLIAGAIMTPPSFASPDPGAQLVVEINVPESGEAFAPGSYFDVHAKVSNQGDAVARNVVATITIDANSSLAEGEEETQLLGDINPAGFDYVTWLLHCDSLGDSTIAVTAAGMDDDSGEPVIATTVSTFVRQIPALQAVITEPIMTETQSPAFTPCDYFTVTATVSNPSTVNASNVTATIEIEGNAHTDESMTKNLPDISAGGSADVSWGLHCDALGTVNITITPAGKRADTGESMLAFPGYTFVVQGPYLWATITEPEWGYKATPSTCPACHNFGVTATVHNWGTYASDVTATISITGNASLVTPGTETKSLGDISGGGEETVSWTLYCNAPGSVWLTVTPAGTDPSTTLQIPEESKIPGMTFVYQGAVLEVTINSPQDGSTFSLYNDFNVEATVANSGTTNARDVSAMIYITGNASTDEPFTKPLPDIPAGGSEDVSWALHCDAPGDVTIMVMATGTDDYQYPTYPIQNSIPDSITIHQEYPPYLVVDITSPANGTVFTPGQDFTVYVTVTNERDVAAQEVSAIMVIDANSHTAEATKSLGNIPSGDSKSTTFTVHCESDGYSGIAVGAAGNDNLGASIPPELIVPDVIIVSQGVAGARLAVDVTTTPISPFSVCQEFTVTATVSNNGGVNAINVEATISYGANMEFDETGHPGQSATIGLDTIAAGASKDAVWYMHCKAASLNDEITVTASGEDAITHEPLIAAEAMYVDQVPPAALSVVVTTDPASPFSVCQGFTVTATVSNTAPSGGASATDVEATISFGDNMEFDEVPHPGQSATIDLDTIAAQGSDDAVWYMHCKAASLNDEITVTASGEDAITHEPLTASDTIHIDQLNPAVLTVEITAPDDGTQFTECQDFDVTATVSNTGTSPEADAINVEATITFGDNIELKDGETATKTVGTGTIESGTPQTVTWHMHCKEASLNDFITVDVEGNDANSGDTITASDTIHVDQVPPAGLWVDVTTAPTSPFSVCQEFTVTATVSNSGDTDAINVEATITYGANMEFDETGHPGQSATIDLDTIVAQGSEDAVWHMHCKEASLEDFITVTASGEDAVTHDPLIDSDTIYIDQMNPAALTVEITAPDDGSEFSVCQDFDVTATVSNTGTSPEADAINVEATITFGTNIELKAGEDATKTVGTGTIESGTPQTVTWHMHCKAASLEDFITVTANGEDAITHDPLTASDTIHIDQVNPAALTVEITAPDDGSEFSVCQDFNVTATVSNTGTSPGADAINVEATITFGDNIELKDGETATKTVGTGTIESGTPQTVTWHMHCKAASLNDEITVTANGEDANTHAAISAPDTIHINQVNPAELEVVITAPDDGAQFITCQDFTVNVTVNNSGEADALSVTATISIDANAWATPPLTKSTTPSDIPGGGSATASWSLHCDSIGDSTITVTAAGTDANTGEPIPDANIDPDSITVHQMVPVEGGEWSIQGSADLSDLDPDVGSVSTEIEVGPDTDAPPGSTVGMTIQKEPSEDEWSAFALAAEEEGLSIKDVAYVVEINHNIPDEDMGPATITMKVGRAWADSYGVDNVKIYRYHNGTCEALTTTFEGYEDGDTIAVFQATSPDGLSTFGLLATSPLPVAAPTNWALIGGLIGGVLGATAIGVLVFFLLRRQRRAV